MVRIACICILWSLPVSYTHLDVYKRQALVVVDVNPLMKQIRLMGDLLKVMEILSLRLIVQTLSKEILKLLVKRFQVKQSN